MNMCWRNLCDCILSLSKDGPSRKGPGPLSSHSSGKFLLSSSLPYWVQTSAFHFVSKLLWLSSSSLPSLAQIIALNAN